VARPSRPLPLAWRWAIAAAAAYIRLVQRTTRWRVEGEAARAQVLSGRGRYLGAVWHGRLLLLPNEKTPGHRVSAMISRSRDGEIIAAFAARFDVGAIRGSSGNPRKRRRDKGGAAAAREAVGFFERHEHATLIITPDGPRGPRMRCQPGIAALSAKLGIEVVPFASATRWSVALPSWDRMLAPLPFGRGAKVYGDLIAPPESDDAAAIEAHRRRIEAALNEVSARADRLAGRAPVTPDPETLDVEALDAATPEKT